MHIVLLHNAFYPNAGGIGTSLYFAGLELLNMGHNVSVVTAKTSKNIAEYETVDGINVYRYDTVKLPMIDFIFPSLIAKRTKNILSKILEKEDVDLIVGRSLHTTSSLIKSYENIELLYFPPNPIGTILRGWQEKLQDSSTLKNKLLKIIYSAVLPKFIELEKNIINNRAKRLACLSLNVATELSNEYGLDLINIKIIPPGIDLQRFTVKARTNRKLPDSKHVLLYVGRLEEEKNPIHLIKAFKCLNLPNIELLIVGDGSLREDCESESEGYNVKFLGHKRDELPELYRNADLFILPSLVEGFGQTIIESLASGTPVVALESNGKEIKTAAKEIIGDLSSCGLVNNTNHNALAKKIEEKILNMPECAAQECRKSVEKRYNWGVFAKALLG